MRADWTSLIGGAVIALAVSGGAAAANDRQPQEDAAVAKARLSGSFYVETNQNETDAYCAKLAKARLSQSFFVATTTPRHCSLKTEPKR